MFSALRSEWLGLKSGQKLGPRSRRLLPLPQTPSRASREPLWLPPGVAKPAPPPHPAAAGLNFQLLLLRRCLPNSPSVCKGGSRGGPQHECEWESLGLHPLPRTRPEDVGPGILCCSCRAGRQPWLLRGRVGEALHLAAQGGRARLGEFGDCVGAGGGPKGTGQGSQGGVGKLVTALPSLAWGWG